jgi:hypothetical protein
MGLTFPMVHLEEWAAHIWLAIFTRPSVYISELVGLGVLVPFAWILFRRRTVSRFIRRGQIG